MKNPFYIHPDYSIVTVPRVGSHYLQERLWQHTGAFIEKHHGMVEGKIITLARDPKDLMISDLAMNLFYKKDAEVDLFTTNFRIDAYADLYESLLDSEIIVDYDDLILYPFETTKAVANALDIGIIDEEYESTLTDQPEISHLVSSKNTDEYAFIQDFISQCDLSRLYEIHNRMLSKAIDINMLNVLCFDCGGMYKVNYGVPNPTKQCPKHS